MKIHTFAVGLIALAFGAGYAARETPVSAQGQNRILEIRYYTVPDKTGLDNLVKRMVGTAKIFDRIGMKGVFYGVAAEPPLSENTYIYILSHENREKAKENWSRFSADPEWKTLSSTAASPGKLDIKTVFVNPTDFSPAPVAAAQGPNRIFELRTYTAPDKTGLDNLVTRMRTGEAQVFNRVGMKGVFFSVAAEPPLSENTYVYMLAHENREKAKESWSKFSADEGWKTLRSTAAPTGQIKVESTFLNPTDFSPIR